MQIINLKGWGEIQTQLDEIKAGLLEIKALLSPETEEDMPSILYRDSATWITWRWGHLYIWTSHLNGLNNTGKIEYGYFTLGSKMHLGIMGSKNSKQKVSLLDENNTVLIATDLNVLLPSDLGECHPIILDTSSHANAKAKLVLDDTDSTTSTWMAFNPQYCIVEQ